MTFELAPLAGVIAVGIIALAIVGGVIAVASVVDFIVHNRPVRVARQQSIPTYYRSLAFSR
ncbi:MAG: hypothetical protein L0H93_12005 [Nocardioides sp.]|nr:hypothetical protein [Nocardioides sp.]